MIKRKWYYTYLSVTDPMKTSDNIAYFDLIYDYVTVLRVTERWIKLHYLRMTSARPGRNPRTVDRGNDEQLGKINYKSLYKHPAFNT